MSTRKLNTVLYSYSSYTVPENLLLSILPRFPSIVLEGSRQGITGTGREFQHILGHIAANEVSQ